MFKNIFLFIVLLILGIAFWLIPNFREISAGVAILLFGMISLENGFKSFAEGPLKKLLSKATDKFYKSFTAGVVSTALLQSSSLISVITISFLSAGFLTLYQGVGIIFGANLGTTATTWLVAILGLKLNISAIAMPMLVFGIVLYLQTNRSLKGIGNILSGLGFFFFGIALMKAGFESYQDSLDLSAFAIEGLWGEIVFLLFGIVITVVLQSSSASMAVILTALAAGQISYLNAMTLAIGANVGTTITAIIGAIASNVNGKRIAVAHLLFNVITGIIALIFLNQLEWIVDRVAFGLNISQQDYTLKLAIFHTAFNILGIIVMRPFVLPMVKVLNTYLKDKTLKPLTPKYLNEAALAYPQSALQVMLKETEHLFVICFEAIAHGLGLSRTTVMSKEEMKALSGKESIKYEVDINEIYYNRIKVIYGKILKFGTRAQENFSDAKYFHTINDIMEANRYFIEVVKDVKDIQPNVLKYCESDNEIIRNEYNKIRKRIAKFIRLVFEYKEFKVSEPMTADELADYVDEHITSEREILNQYIEKLKSKDILYNGSLNKLIIEDALSSQMVSSLINDNGIANSINKHLMKAAKLLYLNTEVILVESKEEDE